MRALVILALVVAVGGCGESPDGGATQFDAAVDESDADGGDPQDLDSGRNDGEDTSEVGADAGDGEDDTAAEDAPDPSDVVDAPDAVESDGGGDVDANEENRAPIADAGGDQEADEGQLVTLDAGGSSDPEGAQLTWSWTQLEGPRVELRSDGPVATFVAPSQAGRLVFGLVVSDGALESAMDRVTVTVLDVPPVADAGPDRVVAPEQVVRLDASGTVDADAFEVVWRQTQGPRVALSDVNALRPTFVAPDEETLLEFGLRVVDADLGSDSDTVRVTTRIDRTVSVDPELGSVGTLKLSGLLPENRSRSVFGALLAGTRDGQLEIWNVEADAAPFLLGQADACDGQTDIDATRVAVVCDSDAPERVRMQLFRHVGGAGLALVDERERAFVGRPVLLSDVVAVSLGSSEVGLFRTDYGDLTESSRISSSAVHLVGQGSHLYVLKVRGDGVAAFDVSDPEDPVRRGDWDGISALDLAVHGGQLWVLGQVSDVRQLVRLGRDGLEEIERHPLPWAPRHVRDLAVDENHFYFGDRAGVAIAHRSAPSRRVRGLAAILLGNVEGALRTLPVPGGILTQGALMAVSPHDTGLRDIQLDESSPLSVPWSEDVLLVGQAGDLHILDVSDPDRPQALAVWEGPSGTIHGAHRSGDVAFLRGTGHLHTVDLSDLRQPRTLATLEGEGFRGDSGYVHDGRLYVAATGAIVDVADPAQPALLAVHRQLSGAKHNGHKAVVRDGGDAVFYSLEDARDPEVLRTVPLDVSHRLLGWFADALVLGGEREQERALSCADPQTGEIRSRLAVLRILAANVRATDQGGPPRVDSFVGSQWLRVAAPGVCELQGGFVDNGIQYVTSEAGGRVGGAWSHGYAYVPTTFPDGLPGAASGNNGHLEPGGLASWTVTGTPDMPVRCHATGGQCAVRPGRNETIVTWRAPDDDGAQHEIVITVGDARIFQVLSRDRVYVAPLP